MNSSSDPCSSHYTGITENSTDCSLTQHLLPSFLRACSLLFADCKLHRTACELALSILGT